MNDLIRSVLQRAFPIAVRARTISRHIRRPITVGVRTLIVDDCQILLVRSHGSAAWDMPGGGPKRGESLRAAAAREAREETGCHVEPDYLLGVYLAMHDGMTNHVAVYVCHTTEQPTDRINIEIAEARRWPIDALPTPTWPSVQRRLAEYQAGGRGLDTKW